jgi:hypothetical protein
MTKMVLTSEFLSINSNDLSTYLNKCEVVVEVDEKEVTTYGSGGWKEYLGGLKAGTLAVEFKQDYADNALDEIMWALLGTVVPFEVRPTSANAGTSNPSYEGDVLISKWSPIEGSIGDEATASATWPTSGAVTRETT